MGNAGDRKSTRRMAAVAGLKYRTGTMASQSGGGNGCCSSRSPETTTAAVAAVAKNCYPYSGRRIVRWPESVHPKNYWA